MTGYDKDCKKNDKKQKLWLGHKLEYARWKSKELPLYDYMHITQAKESTAHERLKEVQLCTAFPPRQQKLPLDLDPKCDDQNLILEKW